MPSNRVQWLSWPVVVHSARTAVATLASFLIARLCRVPEAYWAPITTIVITQSSLGAALKVSWERFAGTLAGAALGGLVATYSGPHALIFAVCVFALGLISALARIDRAGYRFGGVTLAIVLFLPRVAPAWQVAFNRFAAVSVGIITALIFTFFWPEMDETPMTEIPSSSQTKNGGERAEAST